MLHHIFQSISCINSPKPCILKTAILIDVLWVFNLNLYKSKFVYFGRYCVSWRARPRLLFVWSIWYSIFQWSSIENNMKCKLAQFSRLFNYSHICCQIKNKYHCYKISMTYTFYLYFPLKRKIYARAVYKDEKRAIFS